MRTALTAQLALALGLATWAQLALVPLLLRRAGAWSVVTAAASLAALAAAAQLSRAPARRSLALGLAAGVFPCALGVGALAMALGPLPRFDLAARALAALTGLAYLAAVSVAWRGAAPAAAYDVVPLDAPPPRRDAPAWKPAALVALAVVGASVAVLMPAALTARGPSTLAERLGGDALARGRAGLVTAGGLALALVITLGAGGALLRRAPPRRANPARAGMLLLWAGVLALIRYWIDHSR